MNGRHFCVVALLVAASLFGCTTKPETEPVNQSQIQTPAATEAQATPTPAPTDTPAPTLSPEEQTDAEYGFAADTDDSRRIDYTLDTGVQAARIYSFAQKDQLQSVKFKYVFDSEYAALTQKNDWVEDSTFSGIEQADNVLYATASPYWLSQYQGYNRMELDWEIDDVLQLYAPAEQPAQQVDLSQELASYEVRQYNHVSMVATQIRYLPDRRLEIDLQLSNDGPERRELNFSHLVVNGWYVEASLVSDCLDTEDGSLLLPAHTECQQAMLIADARDTYRFADMGIDRIVTADVSVYVLFKGEYKCQIRTKILNPEENPDCYEFCVPDGKQIFDDGRIRVTDLGKDELFNATDVIVENLRTIDDWGYLYENISGNMSPVNAYTLRGFSSPFNFYSPAKSKTILHGASTDVFCRKYGLEKPKRTKVGLSFENTDPIEWACEVPGGTAKVDQPMLTRQNSLYDDGKVRLCYLGIDQYAATPTLLFLLQNQTIDQYYCLQVRDAMATVDGARAYAYTDDNVVSPGAQTVLRYCFDDACIDLSCAEKLTTTFWIQQRNKVYWGGLINFPVNVQIQCP